MLRFPVVRSVEMETGEIKDYISEKTPHLYKKYNYLHGKKVK